MLAYGKLDDAQIASQVAHEQVCGLPADAGCVATRQEKGPFDSSPDVRNGRFFAGPVQEI